MTPGEDQVRNAVAQQAGSWFIANQAGLHDESERAAFVAWLKASPIHVEEYLGVALVAHDLAAATDDPQMPLEALIDLARADDADGVVALEASLPMRQPPAKAMRTPRRWAFATSMAAAVLVLGASVIWWLRDGELLGLPKAYQTAHGEQSVVTLPDGSELRLNTDSAVTVRYARSERVVELARGQAFFTVARDDQRRFRVAAGTLQLLALGTRFDGYRKPDSAIVTVAQGSVAVLVGQPPPPIGRAFPPGALLVKAGYQVRVDTGATAAQPVSVDVQQAVAWLQKKIAFEQRPLVEVADEFNRYGTVPIEIDDAALRSLRISGVFDAYDVDSFVAFLRTLDGVRVERTPARIRVFRVTTQRESNGPDP